ncbi:hypothetical protein Pan161_36980 [Gimesia algae]|uniref:Uncharacterized protein n=1 Tax=Gimesia algae TaxID=2527971 RepID=A0A517VGA3_9PLAN|nr:hypothetical protein Pan161_36980 [Gimesia algae]
MSRQAFRRILSSLVKLIYSCQLVRILILPVSFGDSLVVGIQLRVTRRRLEFSKIQNECLLSLRDRSVSLQRVHLTTRNDFR